MLESVSHSTDAKFKI